MPSGIWNIVNPTAAKLSVARSWYDTASVSQFLLEPLPSSRKMLCLKPSQALWSAPQIWAVHLPSHFNFSDKLPSSHPDITAGILASSFIGLSPEQKHQQLCNWDCMLHSQTHTHTCTYVSNYISINISTVYIYIYSHTGKHTYIYTYTHTSYFYDYIIIYDCHCLSLCLHFLQRVDHLSIALSFR